MAKDYLFTSKRIGFRQWSPEDSATFQQMNADPEVMEFFPFTLTKKQSDELQYWCHKHIEDFGYGFFAVDQLSTGDFMGFIGCKNTRFEADFMPATEIGWRLDKPFWGQGLATEGAIASLDHLFTHFRVEEVVSFTATTNKRSERVMQKLGMKYQGNFEHPLVDETSGLKKHVLYKIRKSEWQKKKS